VERDQSGVAGTAADFARLKEEARQKMLERGSLVAGDAATDDDDRDDDREETEGQAGPVDESADVEKESEGEAAEAADPDEDEAADEDEDSEEGEPEDRTAEGQDGAKKPSRLARKIEPLKARIAELEAGQEARDAELLAKFEAAQAEREALRKEASEREAHDERVRENVNRLVGDPREREALVRQVTKIAAKDDLDVTPEERQAVRRASARIDQIDANREALGLLGQYAELDVQERAGKILLEVAVPLPGVDRKVVEGRPFAEVIAHLHEAGARSARAESEARAAVLEREVETLKGQLSAAKARKPAPAARLSEGGPQDPMQSLTDKGLLDPKTGRPTQAGREAIRTGRVKLIA
jgi:hypothetical protein